MDNNNKNIITIGSIMIVIFIAMIANITYNLREFGLNSVKTKAELVAQSVKNGITSHMINGTMENREFYINETKNLENIETLRIVRSKTVEEQYGLGTEREKDEIDQEVLRTGKIVEIVDDQIIGHSSYRITIPYIAKITPQINCLMCHKTQENNTLGAITMVMSIDDLKQKSIQVIFYTSLISFVLILIILWFVRGITMPYFRIFKSIKHVMKKASTGDYSARIREDGNQESKEVAHWINEHMSKLQTSLISIEDKIEIFLTDYKTDKNKINDPINDVEQTVRRLADIYKFRKTIEHDESIEDVYKRFAIILEDTFDIHNFNFIEADTTNKTTQIVYINKTILCDPIGQGCRADKTNTAIDSCQFKEVCDKFTGDKYYFCIPYSISNDLDFIVSIVCDSQEEHDRVRGLLPFIQDYVDSAKPEIVSKKLMQVLERNAQTDALTGLYNRKFLEKYINSNLYHGALKNIQCGLMMVDIDFFKLINDNYGHDIGDIAIKTVSNTMLDLVGADDVVIRFGGEEFIVIMPNCTEEQLEQLAQQIRTVFAQQQIQANSETFTKTLSIGTSMFPNDRPSFWKYIKQCDIALYKAKQTGRDKVVRFSEDMK